MNEIIKFWPFACIFFGSLVTAAGTYYVARKDSIQQDTIQGLGEINQKIGKINTNLGEQNAQIGVQNKLIGERNEDLTKNVIDLQKLTNTLTTESKKVIEENKKLSEINVNLSTQNKEVGEKIYQLTEVIKNLNTGGSSHIKLGGISRSLLSPGNPEYKGKPIRIDIPFINEGEYALDNVRVKVYDAGDFNKVEPIMLRWQLASSGLNITSFFPTTNPSQQVAADSILKPLMSENYEVIKPGQAHFLGGFDYDLFKEKGLNVFIETKRQDWVILIRMYREGGSTGSLYWAYKIISALGTHWEDKFTFVSPGYPTDQNGNIQWFRTEMPGDWFKKKAQ